MTLGLLVLPETVQRMSPALRAELFALSPFAGLPLTPPADPDTPPTSAPEDPEADRLVELSAAQARRMWEREMAESPRGIIRHFVRENRTAIPYPELIAAVGADWRGGLGAATAALTRRYRSVVPEAPTNVHLYRSLQDSQGVWVLHISPATLAAFREVLGAESV